ncbi:MAG: DUF362 domain-containing protein [Candidatus Omnitrophica bacterium]|nr:DUF362 domain-containing protein [Candidatus Omnitrophota bacterium]
MAPNVYFKPLSGFLDRNSCFEAVLKALKPDLEEFGQGEIVGIKATIGESKESRFIKPQLIKLLVQRLKLEKAKPFVFDNNVIYKGMRQNAVDHLNLAYQKGFSPQELGCPFIIADSVFGTDSQAIKVKFKNLKEIKAPSLIGVLDNLVVASHVTGHMLAGYAASIKNVGMGMASRAGKQMQHSSVKPHIIKDNCVICGCCIEICPVNAISAKDDKAFIDSSVCLGCGECLSACKFNAVSINWQGDANILAERTAEYACAILSRIKRKIFLNFAFDITKECDCLAGNDPKIVQDCGIFASRDILALDKACFDILSVDKDAFAEEQKTRTHLHQFNYAKEIGLGSLEYNLIRL